MDIKKSDQPVNRRFAAFDIDGTLFRSGLYRELIFEMVRMGILDKTFYNSFSRHQDQWFKRSHSGAFREFEQRMVDLLDKELRSIKLSDYDKAVEAVVSKYKDNVYVYTRELLKKLKSEGYLLLAISGSQIELVAPFANYYGFDDWIGQSYERGQQYFTGKINKTHKDKDVFLKQMIDKYQLSLRGSMAIGDSMGDVGILEIVEKPIAFNPEIELMEYAKNHSWQIVIERKNVIYALEANKDGNYQLV